MACSAEGAVRGIMLLLLIMVLVWSAEAQSKREPPEITAPKTAGEIFKKKNQDVTLKCHANGQPTPTYKWYWNSAPISADNTQGISFDSFSGVLKISQLDDEKEGFYHCHASNTFSSGVTSVAVSPKIEVRETRIEAFDQVNGTNYTVNQDEYYYLKCDDVLPVFYGFTVFTWYQSGTDSLSEIDLDARQFIDSDGTLHFSYLKQSDELGDKYYACALSNTDDGTVKTGGRNKLNVTEPASSATDSKPTQQYPGEGYTFTFEVGKSAKLECFFSGKPTPDTTWLNSTNGSITTGDRYEVKEYGRLLIISDLMESDEGNYYCVGNNTKGMATTSVYLNVTSVPMWVHGDLSHTTKVQGEDASFTCETQSAANENEPERPKWYKNAQPFDSTPNPNKFKFSNKDRTLTVLSVQKDTDIACFQCRVHNSVGEVFSDGCLNVILPITIQTHPPENQQVVAGDIVNLTVTATSDDLYPLSYRWVFKGVTYEDPNAPPNVTFNSSTKFAHINTTGFSDDEMKDIAGVYYRYVSNSFQLKTVVMNVTFESDEPVVMAAGFDYWIIGLIIGILLLILVIIIICCVCRRKMLEGDYPVDRKETAAGLDPEKELKDSGFHDLSRADYDYMPEKKPLGDPDFDENIPLDDDESFGDEYGDEAQAFTEDGSFIGVYSKTKKEGPPGYQSGESNV